MNQTTNRYYYVDAKQMKARLEKHYEGSLKVDWYNSFEDTFEDNFLYSICRVCVLGRGVDALIIEECVMDWTGLTEDFEKVILDILDLDITECNLSVKGKFEADDGSRTLDFIDNKWPGNEETVLIEIWQNQQKAG